MTKLTRGDIVWVEFGVARGGAKAGEHPAVVVQNDVGNSNSPLVIVVPLTDIKQYKQLPVQVYLKKEETGLMNKDSCVECGHIRTVDQKAEVLMDRGVVGRVSSAGMVGIDRALRVSLAL